MKKLIVFLLLISSTVLMAQQNNPYSLLSGTQIVWKNESGTTVHAIANGDTLVSQAFSVWDMDQTTLSFVPGSGDTVHFNAYFQVGGGKLPTASSGFYDNGWKVLSALQDSAAVNGVRGAKNTDVTFTPREITGWSTTPGGYQASHDSTGTWDWGGAAAGSGRLNQRAQYVRFVIIGYVGQDVSNTTLLDQCQVTQRRYEK